MKKISIFFLCFLLFFSNSSLSQERLDIGESIHLTFKVLGWQPKDTVGIKYPGRVSKERIQGDLSALAQAHGWRYFENALEIAYEKGNKVAWQGGVLSEKQHLAAHFTLNFQKLREQFQDADSIIIDIIGKNGFTYRDAFTPVEAMNNGVELQNQKRHSEFTFHKSWSGMATYRIRYTLHLSQLSAKVILPTLKAETLFSKTWFFKISPLLILLILLPGVTLYLFIRQGQSRDERGKLKNSPLQGGILSFEIHLGMAIALHLGCAEVCSALMRNAILGVIFGVFPVGLASGLIIFLIVHHYEKDARGTTWSFRENFLTNLRMMVLGAPALLLPFCFFATQKASPHLPFFVFGLLLLAQYALLTALFACVIPFALGWVWKGKPLEDSTLRQRLHQLADKAGVVYRDIILLRTQSSKLANAWVAGILPQWRSVFLTDYLLEHLTLEEIETIFAHELGHIKHRHLLKQVAWIVLGFGGQLLLIHLSLLLFDSLPMLPAWLYWLLFVGVNLGVILLVVQLGLMRFWRGMEFEADAYAVALTQQPAVFLQGLRKLIELNDAPEDLDTFNEMLSTHPNFVARAEAIENL